MKKLILLIGLTIVLINAKAENESKVITINLQENEACSFNGRLKITNKNLSEAEIVVPMIAKGKSIHIVFEVKDNGYPSFVTYKRIIAK